MQKIKSFFLSLLFFIIFSILGIAVALGVGYLILILNEGGAFNSWKELNSPFVIKKIVDANSSTVWVENNDGKLFYYKDIKQVYCDSSDCNQWIETEGVTNDINSTGEQPVVKDNSCQFDNLKFLRKPHGNIVECARGWFAGPEFGTVAYYALLDDGTIWKWEHHGDNILYIFTFLCLILVGFILGISSLRFFYSRRGIVRTNL